MQRRVEVVSRKVKEYLVNYTMGLILSIEKKTCTKMGKVLGIAHDTLYRYLINASRILPIFPNTMIKIANHYGVQKKGHLIIDDTVLSKVFSKVIEGVDFVFNTITGNKERGFCLVVLVWSNGDITIPIGFKLWFNKSISPTGKSKIELAKQLIKELSDKIKFDYLLADGLYSTQSLLKFLCEHKISFLMKIHRNRVVISLNNIKDQLKHHPDLKLMRNQRFKKLKACWGGLDLFFNVIKERGRNGDYVQTYLVSNMDLPDKEYKNIYAKRWAIEVMFRSMKQSLGIKDCSSQNLEKQTLHFYTVFHSYAFLQTIKIEEKLPNVESVMRDLREVKLEFVGQQIHAFNRNFAYVT